MLGVRSWLLLALSMLLACTEPPKSTQSAWSTPATFVGAYGESGGKSWLTICASKDRYQIVAEGEWSALRSAIDAAPRVTRDPLIVSLVGRTRQEVAPSRVELVVDRVLRVWPEETCLKAGVHTTLDNTYWKLVELSGKPVKTHADQEREVHLLLRIDSDEVRGFAGCNHLSGRYQRDGEELRFLDLTSTLMACPYLDEEQALLAALGRVTRFQSLGESLDLRDDTQSIARLRAVYFR